MSSWSSGLVQIINRVSTMPHRCETCQEFHFCQAGWNWGIFHKPKITKFVWASNIILREKPTPDPYRDVLEGDLVWTWRFRVLKHLPPSSIWAVAERVRGYKVCWLQHPLPFPLCQSHYSFKWLLLSQAAPVYSGRRMVCCEKWSSIGVPGVFKGKKHNLLGTLFSPRKQWRILSLLTRCRKSLTNCHISLVGIYCEIYLLFPGQQHFKYNWHWRAEHHWRENITLFFWGQEISVCCPIDFQYTENVPPRLMEVTVPYNYSDVLQT